MWCYGPDEVRRKPLKMFARVLGNIYINYWLAELSMIKGLVMENITEENIKLSK